jgi:hypothetical protein
MAQPGQDNAWLDGSNAEHGWVIVATHWVIVETHWVLMPPHWVFSLTRWVFSPPHWVLVEPCWDYTAMRRCFAITHASSVADDQ